MTHEERINHLKELLSTKANYFSVMPGAVRYDQDLSYFSKVLYSEVSALANKEGYCYANNAYFKNLYHVDERTIIRTINQLVEKEYLIKKIIYADDSKQVLERRLYLNDKFFKVKLVSETEAPM